MAKRHTYILQARGIDVEVERKAVRRVNLRVRPDGSARMSVPAAVGPAQAQAFLDSHADWLERAVRRALERNAGELRAEAAGAPSPAYVWGAPRELAPGADRAALYKAALARALPGAVARMEAATGLRATGWQLRDMKTRWGSCTPATGAIRVNTRLAAYPPTCLDYVVAHELTHLAEPSHDARFHALLARAYPDEKLARALLRLAPAEASRAWAARAPETPI